MHFIGIYIENYKNIKKQLFNFSNRYCIENGDNSFKWFEKKEDQYIINDYSLRVIIGKNGSGKTSILNCIKEPREENCILFFYDTKGKIVRGFCGGKFKRDSYNYINMDIETYEKNKYTGYIIYKQISNAMTKTVTEALRNLYSEYGDELIMNDPTLQFNMFALFPQPRSFSTGSSEINKLIANIINSDQTNSLETKNYLILYYASFFRRYRWINDFREEGLGKLREVKTIDDLANYHDAVIRKGKMPKHKETIYVGSIIANLKDILGEMGTKIKYTTPKVDGLNIKFIFNINDLRLRGRVCRIFGESVKNVRHLQEYKDKLADNIPEWFYDFLFYFDFFKTSNDGTPILFGDLSTGEQEIIRLFAEIFYQIKPKSTHSFVLLMDEPTNSLHPEWQRRFFDYLNTFIKGMPTEYKLLNDGEKRIQNVILTTHSPFILSDVTEDNVIFIERDIKDGFCNHICSEKIKIKTFGSNINNLLVHPFFVEGSIGEFARKKISEVADYYSVHSSKADEIPIKYRQILNAMDENNFIRRLIEDEPGQEGEITDEKI